MSSRVVMRHRCSTERNHASADSWGGAGSPDWQPALTSVPCFAWFQAGRRQIGPDQDAVIEDLRLLMPLGLDVAETDRVESVTDRHGTRVILQGPLLIDTIGPRRDHLVLLLKGVS